MSGDKAAPAEHMMSGDKAAPAEHTAVEPDVTVAHEETPAPTSRADLDRSEPTTPVTLVSEPPLGARELVDGSLDSATLADRIGMDCSREVGLGDLLAEALAAFEQGRRSRVPGAEQAWQPPGEHRRSSAGD